MNKGVVLAAMTIGMVLSLSVQASDSVLGENQWYISPMFGMNFEDTKHNSNPGYLLNLGLGRQIANNWALEASLFGGKHDGFNELTQMGVGIDVLRLFGSGDSLSPYVVFGTGWMQTDVREHPIINREYDFTSAIGSLGLGVMGPLGGSGSFFRGEVRYRADAYFYDVLTTVGLFRPLGSAGPSTRSRGSNRKMLPDADGDGVPDDIDTCPATPSGLQVDRSGCVFDADGDGVADVRDNCLNTPRGTSVDSRGCKVDDADSDGDGVPDHADICSETPRSVVVGENGCERDGDSDWVVDSLDSCPDTRAGARVDIRGCEITDKIELPGVRFELSSATLMPESADILDQAAATLTSNPGLKVEAAGYTDTTGSRQLNIELSQKRAEAVRRYLISKGVNPANVTAKGYGPANPIADNSQRYGRMRNRRVDLRILN